MKTTEWAPVDGFDLEKAALEAVKSDDNLLVTAGPGSGKTELLAQRASFLLETDTCVNPRRILAISFKRDAAKNLHERVATRCGPALARRFVSLTYDGFGKSLLDHFWKALSEDYRPRDGNYDVVLSDRDLISLFEIIDRNFTMSNNRQVLIKALTSGKLPLDANDSYPLNTFARSIWRSFLQGTKSFPQCLTFSMIARLAEYLVRSNPLLHKCILATYSHVFLDEFQDTTSLQYDLMKTCFHNTKTVLTAVGDNKQRIMVWAGADREVFERFRGEFSAKPLQLLMNHRSAPRLIEIQRILAKKLSDDHVELKANKKWNPDEGVCQIWNFEDYETEARVVADQISQWILDEGLDSRDICIIVKQRPDLYAEQLIDDLHKKNIQARNESQLQDLLTENVVKIVLDFIQIAISPKATQGWSDTVDLIKQIQCIPESDSSDNDVRTIEKELSQSLASFGATLMNTQDSDQVGALIWKIIEYFSLSCIISIFPQYKKGTFLKELIKSLAEQLWKYRDLHGDWGTALDALRGLNTVPIMTIHKSKGLEFDTVVFLGLEDSAFWSFRTQSEEDTCAFFVALSRAKRRVFFTFSNLRVSTRGRVESQQKASISSLYKMLESSGVAEERYF